MEIWVMHPLLPEGGEERLLETDHLAIDWPGLPNLEMAQTMQQLKHQLSALAPDDPPETIMRRAERIWKFLREAVEEDVIAVPLPGQKSVVFAQITGPYFCRRQGNGTLVHARPVKWFPKAVPLRAFYRHKHVFERSASDFFAVAGRDAKNFIRGKLPFRYNRFAKWKWIILAVISLKMLYILLRNLTVVP